MIEYIFFRRFVGEFGDSRYFLNIEQDPKLDVRNEWLPRHHFCPSHTQLVWFPNSGKGFRLDRLRFCFAWRSKNDLKKITSPQFAQQTSGAQRGRARGGERWFKSLIWRGNVGINRRKTKQKTRQGSEEWDSEIVRGNQILKLRLGKRERERCKVCQVG